MPIPRTTSAKLGLSHNPPVRLSLLYERSCLRFSSFLSNDDDDDDNDDDGAEKKNNNNGGSLMAVVRYDNNCATIPYVGTYNEAQALKTRMERNTHKHHIFLLKTSRASVPLGPYSSLDDVKTALRGQQHQHVVESLKIGPRNDGPFSKK
jgi:hypothetical protein